jgi:hypothetical protein
MALAGLFITPSAASASVSCTGALTGVVHDNVFVPAGANCFIANATIFGNVVVDPNGTLELGVSLLPDSQHNVIYGSVSGNPTLKAFTTFGTNDISGNLVLNGLYAPPPEDNGANVCSTNVGGNLVVSDARPTANFVVIGTPAFACPGLRVGGYGFVDRNNLPGGTCGDSPCPIHGVRIAVSHFGGTLEVKGNTGGGFITDNTISGALLCGANLPPLVASGNSVAGPNQAPGGSC